MSRSDIDAYLDGPDHEAQCIADAPPNSPRSSPSGTSCVLISTVRCRSEIRCPESQAQVIRLPKRPNRSDEAEGPLQFPACRAGPLPPALAALFPRQISTYCVATYDVVMYVGMQIHSGLFDDGKSPSRRRSNDPPTLILLSLAGGAKHGHALLKDIEQFAGVKLGPGALYGAITRLEERGLIEPLESDDRRRPYQITGAGSEALADSVAQMRELVRVGQARLKMIPTPRPRLA